MSIFKVILLSLLLSSTAFAQKSYTAEELTPEIVNQLESSGNDKDCVNHLGCRDNLEMFPTVYQDDLTPEELEAADPYFDRWRRRPKPSPQNPFRPEEPEFDRDRAEFPILNRLWNSILRLPIIREVTSLISRFATSVMILGIWLVPAYLFRWRLVWPFDLVTSLVDFLRELAKNTKKPLE